MSNNFFRDNGERSDQPHQNPEQQGISNISRMHRRDNVVRRIYGESSSSSYSPAEQARKIADQTEELARNLEASERNFKSPYTAVPREILRTVYETDKYLWERRNLLNISSITESPLPPTQSEEGISFVSYKRGNDLIFDSLDATKDLDSRSTISLETSETHGKILGYLRNTECPSEIYQYLRDRMQLEGMLGNMSNPVNGGDFIHIICDWNVSVDKLRSIRNAIYEDYICSVMSVDTRKFALKWWRMVNNQICKRYLDKLGSNLENDRLENGKGTYSVAVIEINGKFYEETRTRKSGVDTGAKDYFQYPDDLDEKLALSAKDAEVATLLDIKIALRNLFGFGPYNNITVNIMGTTGPCEGCDYRIQKFVKEFENTELCENFIVNAFYLEAPRIVQKAGFGMAHGDGEEAAKIKLPGGRFFVQDYSKE